MEPPMFGVQGLAMPTIQPLGNLPNFVEPSASMTMDDGQPRFNFYVEQPACAEEPAEQVEEKKEEVAAEPEEEAKEVKTRDAAISKPKKAKEGGGLCW